MSSWTAEEFRALRLEEIDEEDPVYHRISIPIESRIAIIGGGVSGITAAYNLQRNGFRDITILETNEHIGGKVQEHDKPASRLDFRSFGNEVLQAAEFTSNGPEKNNPTDDREVAAG